LYRTQAEPNPEPDLHTSHTSLVEKQCRARRTQFLNQRKGNLVQVSLSQEDERREEWIRRLRRAPISEDFEDFGSLSILDPSTRIKGHEGTKLESLAISKACPDLRSTDEEAFLAEDDRLVIIRRHEGTHTGEFMGIPPTGKRFSVRSISIYRVVDGKKVEDKGMFDWFSFGRQLGIIPPLTSVGRDDTSETKSGRG
jgi:predicted ester cyclase